MEIESNRHSIGVVDSNVSHRQKVNKVLKSFYDVKSWGNCKEALAALVMHPPTLILVNAEVAPWGRLDFIRAVRQESGLRHVPLIYISDSETDENIALAKEAGADSYISKPYTQRALINSIGEYINASVEKEWEILPALQRDALKKSSRVFSEVSKVMMTSETVKFEAVKENCQELVQAIEKDDFQSILGGLRNHDDYTYVHSMRVATMLSLLGHAAGFKNDEQLLLASGGLLHDVGKMMIPHHILNKPGRLTDDEFEIIKTHVPETVQYLKKVDNIPRAVFIIAEQHHEKVDGTGYPHGLKGVELNELARMAAIVDVFSALTDRRVYKPPMEPAKAMIIMSEEMTNHLDSHFVKMFRDVLIDAKILV